MPNRWATRTLRDRTQADVIDNPLLDRHAEFRCFTRSCYFDRCNARTAGRRPDSGLPDIEFSGCDRNGRLGGTETAHLHLSIARRLDRLDRRGLNMPLGARQDRSNARHLSGSLRFLTRSLSQLAMTLNL